MNRRRGAVVPVLGFCAGLQAIQACGGSAKRDGAPGVAAGTPSSGGSLAGAAQGGSAAGVGPSPGGAPSSGGSSSAGTSAAGTSSLAGAAGEPGDAGAAGAGSTLSECASDDDCEVLGDCCGCQGVPLGTLSMCPLACAHNRCLDFPEMPSARCVFGQCVLDVGCALIQPSPTCDPASCPAGTVPSVIDTCYGPCVEATECAQVERCQDCTSPEQACVFEQGAAGIAHCVDMPDGCEEGAFCACMGELCGEHGQPCAELPNGIRCGNG